MTSGYDAFQGVHWRSLTGVIASNATWAEEIPFTELGLPFDITGLDFDLTLCYPGETSPFLTLTTPSDGLSIIDDDDGNPRTLKIFQEADVLSSHEGDVIAELALRDADDIVFIVAKGTVTIVPGPVHGF